MRAFRIGRPSPSLVVSVVALLFALGGTGYAAFSVPKNSVGTKQLKNNAVTSRKIRNGAVTASKLGNGAVTSTKIADGAIGGLQLNLTGVTVPNASHAATAENATTATAAATATTARAVAYAHVLSNGSLDTANSKNVSAASRYAGASGIYCLKVNVSVTNLTATVDAGNSGGAFGFASGELSGQDSGFTAANCPSGDNALVGTSNQSGTTAAMAFWVTFN